MDEGESGLNQVAASADNDSEARHSCKLSYLQMVQSKCRSGFPGDGKMAVGINFKDVDKWSGTG